MVAMFVPVLASLLFLWHASLSVGETGCPEPEEVEPCSCQRLPTVRLTCSGLERPDVLKAVFDRSQRYTFHQVYVYNSSLLYIPSEIFEKVTVKELYLRNVTLQTLFSDLRVEHPDVEKIHLENTLVQRSITAQNFTMFTGLKEINVYNSVLVTIPKHFGELLPKSIKKIILSEAGTKSISKDALHKIPYLDKFAVDTCRLKKLSRDVFPRPFYGRILSFNGNEIASIPEDMFNDMPQLQILSLMNNALSTIPESAFAGRAFNVPYMRLEGNSLQCDCQLMWLIKNKPEVLGGTCSGPERFQGKQLRDLIPAEIKCNN